MKKVFKASLLSLGVAAAFGANAATLIVQPGDKITLSNQGIEVKNTVTKAVVFDTVVDAQHPGLTEVVVTLGDAVDLSGGATPANAVVGGACTVDPGTAGIVTCGDIQFNVGTGSFTFDNVVVDDVAGTITYSVSLGNSITAGSSYRTTIGGNGHLPIVSDVFSVDFKSTLNGNPVDAGTAKLATSVDQFASSVEKEFDGVIERIDRLTFVRNFETGNTVDTFKLNVSDIAADVANPATATKVVVTLKGNFDDNDAGFASAVTDAVVAYVDETTATITYDAVNGAGNGLADLFTAEMDTLTFTKPGGAVTIEPSDFEVESVVVSYQGTVVTNTGSETLVSAADAGEWRLDAAVINVPYLPVGYGLTPNVEIANDSAKSVESEIIIEGFDQNGNAFGPATLPFTARGQKVTKVSEDDIIAAFGLAAGAKHKLSVTFLIDADLEDVSVAPYYRQNESRINVMSDQYKSDTAQGN